MTCEIRHYEDKGDGDFHIVTYTCKDIEMLKKCFRDTNKTDLVIKHMGHDRPYERYCEELESFVKDCQCSWKMKIKNATAVNLTTKEDLSSLEGKDS